MKCFRQITLCLFVLFAGAAVCEETEEVSLSDIQESYEKLQYENTITLGKTYLSAHSRLPQQRVLEVLQYIGLSQVAIGNEEEARSTFRSILVSDTDFQLNSKLASPKVMALFSEVRRQISESTSDNPQAASFIVAQDIRTEARYRSLMFPGLGQNYLNQKRGYIYTAIGGASLGVLVYSLFRVPAAHESYLQAYDETVISEKYRQYNRWYKMRNNSLITYLATWTVSMTDILIFPPEKSQSLDLSFNHNYPGLSISVSF